MDGMDVRLLSFTGCPDHEVAEQRLRSALTQLGHDRNAIGHVLVETPEEAEGWGFIGSPTVLVDGKDPFAAGDEPAALACRVYQTPQGPAGAPSVEQLVAALS